jgi:hypothetical protein
MAARINKMHSEQVRLKIQAANLVQILQKAAEGKEELSATRLGAINSLLDRSVPKLSQIQHVGDANADAIKTDNVFRVIFPGA